MTRDEVYQLIAERDAALKESCRLHVAYIRELEGKLKEASERAEKAEAERDAARLKEPSLDIIGWTVVNRVNSDFTTGPVAAFVGEDDALDWARDNLPYQYTLGKIMTRDEQAKAMAAAEKDLAKICEQLRIRP